MEGSLGCADGKREALPSAEFAKHREDRTLVLHIRALRAACGSLARSSMAGKEIDSGSTGKLEDFDILAFGGSDGVEHSCCGFSAVRRRGKSAASSRNAQTSAARAVDARRGYRSDSFKTVIIARQHCIPACNSCLSLKKQTSSSLKLCSEKPARSQLQEGAFRVSEVSNSVSTLHSKSEPKKLVKMPA